MREIFEFPSATGSGGFSSSSHSRSPSGSGMTSLEVVALDSNSTGWSSPRISFSTGFAGDGEPHVPNFLLDIRGTEPAGPIDEDSCRRQSSVEAGDESSEFEFAVSRSQEFNPVCQGLMLPADELFFKGKLLPLHHSRRTQMVEQLSSGQSNRTDAAATKSRTQAVHYYASPSPFPFPLAASSPQPVRCPPQETPPHFASSPPFPYPIASSALFTPQSCAQAGSPSPYLPLPSPRYRKSAKWKQVLRSLRRAKKDEDLVSADQSDDACSRKALCEDRRPKVLRMFLRGNRHSHRLDKLMDTSAAFSELEGECLRSSQPADVGTSSAATQSKDDERIVAPAAQSRDPEKLLHDRLPQLTCRTVDRHLMGRSYEVTRPFKCRDASEGSSVAAKMRGGPGSPGKRSPGRGSPGKVSMKVAAEKSNPGRQGSLGKIVLKNLERVSSPSRRGPWNKDTNVKGSEKPGSYTASVRVMPVLNVPSVCIKPGFRAAKLSTKGRLGELRHMFAKREAPSPASSPLLHTERTA